MSSVPVADHTTSNSTASIEAIVADDRDWRQSRTDNSGVYIASISRTQLTSLIDTH